MFIAAIIFVTPGVFLALELGYLVIVVIDWLTSLFVAFFIERHDA